MASSAAAEEQEEVSILEKVLKILIVVVGLSVLYSYVEPIFSEITRNAQSDRVTRDFQVVSDAISRYQLAGKRYTDTTLGGLVEKKLLEAVPKDPWGNEYVYSWFFEELICPGPNRVVNTFVPGLREEATDADSDDRIKPVAPTSKLIFASNQGGTSQILKADVDGFSTQTIEQVPGEIQGLSVLPSSKLIVYSFKRGGAYDLRMIDYGTSERTDLTSDAAQDLNPCWASARNDCLVFQSDRETPGVFSVFAMQLPAKTVTKVADKPAPDPAPGAVAGDRRIVYFTSVQGDRHTLQSITLPEAQTFEAVSGRGIVLKPCPSPNNSYLAYLVQEAQGAAIEVIETRSKKQIFRKDGAAAGGFIAWSPDGEKLAYQVLDKGQPKLALVHPATQRTVVHPQFVMALGRFAWVK